MTQAARRSPRAAALLSGWALCLLATLFTTAHAAPGQREVAPGDFAPLPGSMELRGAGPATLSAFSARGPGSPDIAPPGSCTFTVLPNDNSTSGNERCPTLRNRFGRSIYLITAAELAANGLQSGSSITGIGWNYQTAQGVTGSGPLVVYLQNTSDATNLKSTTWATAITGMTTVHNATTTLPSPAGTFDIAFSGGSPFTYTGGGLYVAFDMQYPVGTLSATTVAWCNSLGLVNGLLGNQSNTAAPTTLAASSFRPETRFTASVSATDASVDLLVSYGQVALGLSGAQSIQALITNKGSATLTNLPVTLTITGAESFTDTQVIPSLPSCGGQTTVTFAPFTPTLLGSDVMTISVPSDANNANNSQTKTLTVTMPTESYKYVGTTSAGGFGFTGATGAFVCRFTTVAASNITQVTPEFAATSATTYKIAIFKDSGVGTPGTLLYADAANRTVGAVGPVTITLPAPVAVGPGTFFVGIEQTNTTNASLAFDTEAPVRSGTFFLGTGLPPATWSDFAPGNNFKPNVGITLDRCNIAPTVSNNGPLCAGGTLQLTASAAGAASYSWTGPNGFSSSQQNPTLPGVSALNAGLYTCTVNGCASGGSASTNVVVNTGPYSIVASAAAGGTMSPGNVSVACGGSQTYTITPGPCSAIQDVVVDGVSQGAIASYTFSNVTANHTLSATFSLVSYSIVSSAGAGGSIAPLGTTPVSCGSSQGYTITPAVGYQVSDVLVDGVSQGPIGSYTFNTVGANHTIAASFSLASALVAGASPASICPASPCATVPVNLTRTSSTGVLAFSVTFQLLGDLALCSGTGSITEGTFLSGVGPTLFNVVSLGGNSYRADGALTANCGATATSGLLFNVGVTSSGTGGAGSLTVTAVSLRDCSNHVLPAGAGAPAAVPYDNQAPVVTVTSPNGGEVLAVGSAFPITWSASDNVGVANVDIAYSTDGGASYPNPIATAVANTGSYAWTVPNTPTATARVRVTAHDTGCSSAADASDNNFAIGALVAGASPAGCLTPAHTCVTVPVNIARSDAAGIRLFHVVFTLSPNLQLCGPAGTNITEGTYLSSVNPNTTFFVLSDGGGQYTADGTINGTPCGATAATGTLFDIHVAANGGSGAGTVTVNAVTLRDCLNNDLPSSPGAPANVTIDTAPVAVAAIPTPQFVQETSTLTVTPSATLTSCATGPVTWSVAPPLPAGASLNTGTGVVTWTPPCGSVGSYGPFTLTATAASGDAGSSNPFTIQVTHHAGTVSVSNIPSPQTVTETNTLTTPTPVATLGACATGPVTWSVAPPLPAGASFGASTGVITWTPPCGSAGNHGPFTLTATAATGETGSGNAFTIQVDHKIGTVTIAAIPTPQTVAELSTLTITPVPTLTSCAAAPLTWTVAPPLPSGALLNSGTGVITWTPDCHAAEGGSSGDYGPFTLTATAATGESGGSNAFTIHVTDTPTSIGPATAVSAAQVLTGNPPGERTGITLHFTAASGTTTAKVYRAPFGHYPYYDDAGGAAPPAPGAYPPSAPWVLTPVMSDGGLDTPSTRDFWYYVVYDVNACGDVSAPSAVTTGTLDYHLGDVTDGFVHGQGDNQVLTNDISELGAHYGISLGPLDPLGYLDVGPTTTHYVDGRPLTDLLVNFEDLILFAINYAHVSSPATRPASVVAGDGSKSITADELVVSAPDHVSVGEVLSAPLVMRGTGAVQGLSIRLSWNPAVVVPTGYTTGQFLRDLDGAAFSAKPGSVDVAMLGVGRGFTDEGELVSLTFRVVGAGDPRIAIESVDARDTHNQSVRVGTSRESQAPLVPRITAMQSATPNPFRGSVALGFALARPDRVQFDIYSVDGRRVKTVTSGAFEAGEYSFSWDGRDEGGNAMAAGVYYARLVAGPLKFSRTITLLK